MKKKKTFIGLALIIAVLVLGVGYAAISSIKFEIKANVQATADNANFKVEFTDAAPADMTTEGVTGTATIDQTDKTKATIDVSGLKKMGDMAIFEFEVTNKSESLAAKINQLITSEPNEYFVVQLGFDEVSNDEAERILQPTKTGDTAQVNNKAKIAVGIALKKTPITEDPKDSITISFNADPTEPTA